MFRRFPATTELDNFSNALEIVLLVHSYVSFLLRGFSFRFIFYPSYIIVSLVAEFEFEGGIYKFLVHNFNLARRFATWNRIPRVGNKFAYVILFVRTHTCNRRFARDIFPRFGIFQLFEESLENLNFKKSALTKRRLYIRV